MKIIFCSFRVCFQYYMPDITLRETAKRGVQIYQSDEGFHSSIVNKHIPRVMYAQLTLLQCRWVVWATMADLSTLFNFITSVRKNVVCVWPSTVNGESSILRFRMVKFTNSKFIKNNFYWKILILEFNTWHAIVELIVNN